MHISSTSIPAARWTKAASVIVDWSSVNESSVDAERVEREHLLEWIRGYPERRAIHVYVRGSLGKKDGKRFQSTLQSLGCRVTTKSLQLTSA